MSEPAPSELADLVSVVLDIARHPDVWDARVAEMRAQAEAAEQRLEQAVAEEAAAAEERRLADAALKEARQAVADAAYLRKQCDAKEASLIAREGAVTDREAAAAATERRLQLRDTELGTLHTEILRRESELDGRATKAAQTLAEAKTLMAGYDKAKHDAALKLAS